VIGDGHPSASSQQPSGLVTVTHPHHPLCGQQVEIVRIRRGADPDLIVRLPDGLHAAVAMSLTNYTAPSDYEPPPVPIHLLDFNGLRQVVQLIDHIHQEGRYPSECEGETCSSVDLGYD
jgi:hypothetical protein